MTFLRMHPYLFTFYLVIAAIAIGVLVDGISESNGDTGSPAPQKAGHVLELIVQSSASSSATITYVTPGSDPIEITQHHRARLPWRKRFSGVRPLQIGFNLKALQSGSGRLTCIIRLDGEIVEQKSARGQSALVTCSP